MIDNHWWDTRQSNHWWDTRQSLYNSSLRKKWLMQLEVSLDHGHTDCQYTEYAGTSLRPCNMILSNDANDISVWNATPMLSKFSRTMTLSSLSLDRTGCVQEWYHVNTNWACLTGTKHRSSCKWCVLRGCIIIMPGACACEKSERELSADISHSSV